MNRAILQQYLAQYKKEFERIREEEIYKWRAVQHFQNNWDIEAVDFAAMLKESLAKTRNLLESGKYFPRRMINIAANHRPIQVRAAFQALYDEEVDLEKRVQQFGKTIAHIISIVHPAAKNHYQDDRAILVYLCLKYPETYYLYKFTMFRDFCKKVQYDYKPKRGAFSTVQQYLYVCDLLLEHIREDNELLKEHSRRIKRHEYYDKEHHILTQDIIYAITRHLDVDIETEQVESKTKQAGLFQKSLSIKVAEREVRLSASKTDHIAKQKRNKKIGDLGEQLVLAYEKAHCLSKYRHKVSHDAIVHGDGLGYDILSFDEQGNEKYIEVKATSGDSKTTFFITAHELKKSQENPENYFLYRLFNLDVETESANFFIIEGDLTDYCINPQGFQVIIKEIEAAHKI